MAVNRAILLLALTLWRCSGSAAAVVAAFNSSFQQCVETTALVSNYFGDPIRTIVPARNTALDHSCVGADNLVDYYGFWVECDNPGTCACNGSATNKIDAQTSEEITPEKLGAATCVCRGDYPYFAFLDNDYADSATTGPAPCPFPEMVANSPVYRAPISPDLQYVDDFTSARTGPTHYEITCTDRVGPLFGGDNVDCSSLSNPDVFDVSRRALQAVVSKGFAAAECNKHYFQAELANDAWSCIEVPGQELCDIDRCMLCNESWVPDDAQLIADLALIDKFKLGTPCSGIRELDLRRRAWFQHFFANNNFSAHFRAYASNDKPTPLLPHDYAAWNKWLYNQPPLCYPAPDNTACSGGQCLNGVCTKTVAELTYCNETADPDGCPYNFGAEGPCALNESAYGTACSTSGTETDCLNKQCTASGCELVYQNNTVCTDPDFCNDDGKCIMNTPGGVSTCQGTFNSSRCCQSDSDCLRASHSQCVEPFCDTLATRTCQERFLNVLCDDGNICNGEDSCNSTDGTCSVHEWPREDCGQSSTSPCRKCSGSTCQDIPLADDAPCFTIPVLKCANRRCSGGTCQQVAATNATCNNTGVVVDCAGTQEIRNGTCSADFICVENTPIDLNCSCTDDANCTDGNDCTDDFCDNLFCQFNIVPTRTCDDQVFCNGLDQCGFDGRCSVHSGDPCSGGARCNSTCNEQFDNCYASKGTDRIVHSDLDWCLDQQCDGSGGIETQPTSACTSLPSQVCVQCNSTRQSCYAIGIPCTDSDPCNGDGTDICEMQADNRSSCKPSGRDNPCFSEPVCRQKCTRINATAYTCLTPDNDPCDNGVYCDGTLDICRNGICTGGDAAEVKCGRNMANAACGAASVCNETSRSCTSPENAPCDDNNPCTVSSTCNVAGECGCGTNFSKCSRAVFEDGKKCTINRGSKCEIAFCNINAGTCVDSGINPCDEAGKFDIVKQCYQYCDVSLGCVVGGKLAAGCDDKNRATCSSFCTDDPNNPCQGNLSSCPSIVTTGLVLPPPVEPPVIPIVRTQPEEKLSDENSSWVLWLIIGLAALCILTVGIIGAGYLIRQQREHAQMEVDMREIAMMAESGRLTRNDLREMFEETLLEGPVTIDKRLGSGSFGDVYKGTWQGSTTVALKTLKEAQGHALNEFATEALTLKEMRHPNCLQFLGVWVPEMGEKLVLPGGVRLHQQSSTSSSKSDATNDHDDDETSDIVAADLFMITEYMSLGSLDAWCRTMAQTCDVELSVLLDISRQAAAGMAYLASRNVIHRDLALRNLLATSKGGGASGVNARPGSAMMSRVSTPQLSRAGSVASLSAAGTARPQQQHEMASSIIVKVADFGLSRILNDEESYYKTDCRTMPIKWSAPEAVEFGKFSTKTDVWSFGVVLWELFSGGRMPYPGMSNGETIDAVLDGYRMPRPETMPEVVYDEIVMPCWQSDAKQRPDFSQLQAKLIEISRRLGAEVVHAGNRAGILSTVGTPGLRSPASGDYSLPDRDAVTPGESFYHGVDGSLVNTPAHAGLLSPAVRGESFYHGDGGATPEASFHYKDNAAAEKSFYQNENDATPGNKNHATPEQSFYYHNNDAIPGNPGNATPGESFYHNDNDATHDGTL